MPLKLHILSDLHIETGGFVLPESDADVLVLAGNVGRGAGGLVWLRHQGFTKPVIYVPGPYELCGQGLAVLAELKESAPPGVHVLVSDSVVSAGVRFIGAMVWTDAGQLNAPECFFSPSGSSPVLFDPLLMQELGILTPQDAVRLHHQSRERLVSLLSQPFSGKTLVITTHALVSANQRPLYTNHRPNRTFIRQFDPLVKQTQPALWIHGGVAEEIDMKVAGSRIVSRPVNQKEGLTKLFNV
ncbi:MAG: hypothetical protein OEZ39_00775 [Gammaproteobacteria bacterium]|nr:hypothetical protein [Gammaproteobacteria bacterium]MDH5650383.1 hypothetical protein [Gammaproteobacteria bacterium]